MGAALRMNPLNRESARSLCPRSLLLRRKRQISIDGGYEPDWRKDGKELFFGTPGGMLMGAEIKTAPKIEAGIPKAIFKLPTMGLARRWAPAAGGKRFLVIEGEQQQQQQQQTAPAQVFVVLNWTAELKRP